MVSYLFSMLLVPEEVELRFRACAPDRPLLGLNLLHFMGCRGTQSYKKILVTYLGAGIGADALLSSDRDGS